MWWIYLLIGVVIMLMSIFIYHKKYEDKVYNTLKIYYDSIENFKPLFNMCFDTDTSGFKIKIWDEQHKIDYIINRNISDILKNIQLYNDYENWCKYSQQKVIDSVLKKASAEKKLMILFGNAFLSRINESLDHNTNYYSLEKIKFKLRTFTYRKNLNHYNPNTKEWWTDESHIKITFKACLSYSEIISRVLILNNYKFKMTEYEYKCEDQRKLMTEKLRRTIILRDNKTCQLCGKKCKENEIEIDHIIPVSKGGKTCEDNLQVLCRDCNRRKSNKIIREITKKIPIAKEFNGKKNNITKTEVRRVKISDNVVIKYIEDGEEVIYKIVEEKINENDLSIIEPLGKAILGKEKGHIVTYKITKGTKYEYIKVEIVNIY